MSRLPKVSIAVRTASARCPASPACPGTATATSGPPSDSTASASASALRAVRTTRAPRSTRLRAIPSPMPRLPPVTRAVRPSIVPTLPPPRPDVSRVTVGPAGNPPFRGPDRPGEPHHTRQTLRGAETGHTLAIGDQYARHIRLQRGDAAQQDRTTATQHEQSGSRRCGPQPTSGTRSGLEREVYRCLLPAGPSALPDSSRPPPPPPVCASGSSAPAVSAPSWVPPSPPQVTTSSPHPASPPPPPSAPPACCPASRCSPPTRSWPPATSWSSPFPTT